MSTMHSILEAMPPETREALLAHSRQVTIPAGTGRSVSTAVAAVIADRLDSARTRLLDLSAPHGSGTPLAYAR
ncbi:hypothetical protein [Streptomyces erythrochromogenes]|uniref:hypothetical protein n=1 Tax=Streptomyces erythrochromogenes TaxID=285574 RepID=UPI0036C16866